MTTGSSGGFLLAFLAAFDAGDTVAMARPGYPAYRNMLAALGCHVVELPCQADTRFQPTVAQLEALPEPPAGLVVASPANPTGTMVLPDEMAALSAWCAEHGTRLISDEIYHGITFDVPGTCAWSADRSAVVVNSFSKYYCMTGWRIGWLLMPDDLADAIDRLTGNFTICPPTLSQLAASAAFDAYDELDANVARYAQNRAIILDGLRSIGMDRLAPADGAFYVYADVSRWTDDSVAWCTRILDETGVALVPGVDFDPVDGGKYVRMCFAGDACGAGAGGGPARRLALTRGRSGRFSGAGRPGPGRLEHLDLVAEPDGGARGVGTRCMPNQVGRPTGGAGPGWRSAPCPGRWCRDRSWS